MAQFGVGSSAGADISNIEPQSGLLAMGSNNGDLAILKLATNEIIHRQYGSKTINCVKFSSDGTYLFASVGRNLYVLPGENLNEVIRFYEDHTDAIVGFCQHLEQPQVYTCSQRSIKLWDLRSAYPYHTFNPKGRSKCIDILSTENVLLTGDSTGYLNSWNLRTMTQECSHTQREIRSVFTTIAVSPNNSWICAGSVVADVYEYKYSERQYVFQHVIPGKSTWDSVVQCTFPRAATGRAVVAFDDFIGEYEPAEYEHGDESITWTKDVSSYLDGEKIASCSVNADGTVFYSGHSSGKVASYTLDSDLVKILPVDLEGAVTSLDFLHL